MKPSFTTWLLEQTDRLDPVGDLAIHYEADAQEAPRAITVAEVLERMHTLEATPEYYQALQLAAEEYQREAA